MSEDWYKDKNGIFQFDASVHSQADPGRMGIGGKYAGKAFTYFFHYGPDGMCFAMMSGKEIASSASQGMPRKATTAMRAYPGF